MARKPKDVLEHLRREVPGPRGSALEKWIYEKRGARHLAIEIFKNPDLTRAAAQMKVNASDKYGMFFKATNAWLEEVQEADFFKIAELAKQASNDVDAERRQTVESFFFAMWAAQVGERHGYLSPAAIAANFLFVSDHLHRMVKGNTELLNAIYAFADAWHWVHFEGMGEHQLAALGVASEASRAQGPETKKREREQKERITRDALSAYVTETGNQNPAPKLAAGILMEGLNETLAKLKLHTYSQTSLEKAIRAILKEE